MTIFNKKHLFFLFLTLVLTIYSYLYIDRNMAMYFHTLENEFIEELFSFLTIFGDSAWYFIPSILLWIYFAKTNKPKETLMAKYIFMTNLAAGILVWLLKVPFGRARPKLFLEENIYGFQWFEVAPKLVSFPSGHTITIISTMVAFSLLFPKWKYFFLPLGVLVAFSRVAVTAHYMSDVIFASFLGTMVAIVLHRHYFKT